MPAALVHSSLFPGTRKAPTGEPGPQAGPLLLERFPAVRVLRLGFCAQICSSVELLCYAYKGWAGGEGRRRLEIEMGVEASNNQKQP